MTTFGWRPVKEGVLLSLRVTPKSAYDALSGLHEGAGGKVSLAVKVRAQPEQGKANKAVIQLLATLLGMPKSRLSVASGAADRNTTVLIAVDVADISERLAAITKEMKE